MLSNHCDKCEFPQLKRSYGNPAVRGGMQLGVNNSSTSKISKRPPLAHLLETI